MTRTLLMVEDDARLAAMVIEYLTEAGFDLAHAAGIAEARAWLKSNTPDLVILDLMLPDGNGLDLCRELQEGGPPLLILSARGDPMDRIIGLELGADDYLAKPFEPRELLARVRALLRRQGPTGADAPRPLRFGRLEIDQAAHVVRVDGQVRDITSHQFTLLAAMAERAGRVLSREQLMDLAKGEPLEAFDRSIDVHIARIRAAIEDDPKQPRRIVTVRGAGYVFSRVQDA